MNGKAAKRLRNEAGDYYPQGYEDKVKVLYKKLKRMYKRYGVSFFPAPYKSHSSFLKRRHLLNKQ